MLVRDLGLIPYRDAWALQEAAHARALEAGEETLFLLEHPPVITFGRRAADSARNLVATREALAGMGVEVVESDRGGDITLHAPGQLVAYPILHLANRRLSPGTYVHALEDVVIATLAEFGVVATKDPAAPGVWVAAPHDSTRAPVESDATRSAAQPVDHAKICALGVRIRRGASLHGLALNVTTDLSLFNLINPCGLGRPVTRLLDMLGDRAPDMPTLKTTLARQTALRFP
ncbi:MAG TPA: lipoyl(octanoyl) transferase [Tepidisphaeraceae bacterium]|nr:lipoyl(octanoyl) transferase [Tepidisphaeraceae bacterium]